MPTPTYSYIVSQVTAGTLTPDRAKQLDELWGVDIYFDVSDEQGADTKSTNYGDYLIARGRTALRQAVIRRIITNPGEWRTLPDYGVGARLFVKARNTAAARQELEEKIRGQLKQEARIESVDQINIEQISGGLKISVVVTPVGQLERNRPLVANVEVT